MNINDDNDVSNGSIFIGFGYCPFNPSNCRLSEKVDVGIVHRHDA